MGMYVKAGSVDTASEVLSLLGTVGDGFLNGVPADNLLIINYHATQTLAVEFSVNGGANYSAVFTIPGVNGSTNSATFNSINLTHIRVAGSGSSTTYSLAAWHSRR